MGEIIEPMASTSADEPGAGAFPERLAERVRAFATTGFAVLDGGHFDDLPGMLRQAGLFVRSLFLDHADVEVERAGPWLVSLAQGEGAPDQVFAIVGSRPAAVFWLCEGGEAVLYRHLRTLNMARIPAWAVAGDSMPLEPNGGEEYETVMFRHWDPRVLGALLPVLDASQFARIVGPAQEIALWATAYGDLRRTVHDPTWPQAPSGMLTLNSEQTEALNGRRLAASHRRIMDYLRDVAPLETTGVADEPLQTHVAVSDRTGRRLGLESEAAHARWAFLMIKTKGRILNEPALLNFIAHGHHPPDLQVKDLITAGAVALRNQDYHG